MKSSVELIQLLQVVLSTEYPIKQKLIKEFQDEVWNNERIHDDTFNEILSELAYDLDFYERNEEWRKEDSSYYDDDKLEIIIKTAVQNYEDQARSN